MLRFVTRHADPAALPVVPETRDLSRCECVAGCVPVLMLTRSESKNNVQRSCVASTQMHMFVIISVIRV